MYKLFEIFKEEKISLAYFGLFSDCITSMLIELCDTYLAKSDNLKKFSKKTSFLIAESFQNIVRHSVIEKECTSNVKYNKDFYQISIVENRINIASVNIIENDQIQSLNNHIDHINSLDSCQLKELSKHVLEHGAITEKGGVGLGLIEIVRKSGLPLKKQFTKLNDTYSIVLLGLEISNLDNVSEPSIDLNSIEKYYRKLLEDDILLLYKGDFSSSSNSQIIDILNNNFIQGGEIEPDKLKNIIIIIEIMQNVSQHGKLINSIKEGFFTIKKKNNEVYIECSNYIDSECLGILKQQLDKIKSCTNDELERLYKQALTDSYLSEDDNAGLGLLEIARLTNNSFAFNFTETPDGEILYSVQVKTI